MQNETLFTRETALELKQQIATRFPDMQCVVTQSPAQDSIQYYIVGLWNGDTCLVTFSSYEKFELFLSLVRSLADHLATEDERAREDECDRRWEARQLQADIDYRRAILRED